MAEREVRYCTTEDGVRIAWCVEGEGPPLLISADFFESFAREHTAPQLHQFRLELAQGRKTVRFDYRGTGLSQRENLSDFGLQSMYRDLDAVVTAAELDRFTIWSSGIRGMVAIDYAASNPENVVALLLWGAYASVRDAYPPAIVTGFAELSRNSWPVAAQLFADMSGVRREFPDEAMMMGELFRESTTGEVVAETFLQGASIDVTDTLPQVKCRTLIMHRINDEAAPFSQAQKLAAGIPNARLVPFEGVHNEVSFGDYSAIIATIDTFLDADPESRRREPDMQSSDNIQGDMLTVLFTDLVRHTEMMSRLGDGRGRDVLRQHERITREVLKAHGGTEVKTMGDGFMASFGSVTKAMECAVALQRAFAEHTDIADEPLNVRVGLDAGEPIKEDGDLFGATVIRASRIAAKAEGGEILVADTVRGLCSGKGFLFSDRGEFVAKGFEEPVRLFEVLWRE